MEEVWKEYKLGEIAKVTMGQSPESSSYNNSGSGIPFMQGNRTFGMKYPSFDTYTTTATKIAEANDVIMSVRAPVGDVNITPNKMCLGRGLCSVRANNGNQEFLYYLLRYYSKELINKETGTVFGSVNRNDVNNLRVKIPNDETQNTIADILSSIDNKIDVNRRISDNLEQQTRTMFKSWKNRLKGNAHSFIRLDSIASFISGYSYKGAELAPSKKAMATIKNFSRNGGFKMDGYKEIEPSNKIKPDQHADMFDVLVAHTDITQNADVIGNAEMILSLGGYKSIIFSMDLVKVVPKPAFPYRFFLATILQDSDFKSHCMGYVNGTTVLHMNKKALPNYTLALPDDMNNVNRIDNCLSMVYKKIAEILSENTRLSQLRDTLLPRLMSGDLKVNELK